MSKYYFTMVAVNDNGNTNYLPEAYQEEERAVAEATCYIDETPSIERVFIDKYSAETDDCVEAGYITVENPYKEEL